MLSGSGLDLAVMHLHLQRLATDTLSVRLVITRRQSLIFRGRIAQRHGPIADLSNPAILRPFNYGTRPTLRMPNIRSLAQHKRAAAVGVSLGRPDYPTLRGAGSPTHRQDEHISSYMWTVESQRAADSQSFALGHHHMQPSPRKAGVMEAWHLLLTPRLDATMSGALQCCDALTDVTSRIRVLASPRLNHQTGSSQFCWSLSSAGALGICG